MKTAEHWQKDVKIRQLQPNHQHINNDNNNNGRKTRQIPYKKNGNEQKKSYHYTQHIINKHTLPNTRESIYYYFIKEWHALTRNRTTHALALFFPLSLTLPPGLRLLCCYNKALTEIHRSKKKTNGKCSKYLSDVTGISPLTMAKMHKLKTCSMLQIY